MRRLMTTVKVGRSNLAAQSCGRIYDDAYGKTRAFGGGAQEDTALIQTMGNHDETLTTLLWEDMDAGLDAPRHFVAELYWGFSAWRMLG